MTAYVLSTPSGMGAGTSVPQLVSTTGHVPRVVTTTPRHVIQDMDIQREYRPWSWGAMSCSIFSIIFCNLGGLVCGTIAMVMSLMSYVDHRVGMREKYRRRNMWAWYMAVIAVIIGTIVLLVIIIVPLTSPGLMREWVNKDYYH